MTAAEEAGLPPAGKVVIEKTREPTPWRRLLKRIGPTMIVYFCYGWTGWLFFTWLPTFFMHGRGLDLKSSALFSAGVFLSGVVGNTAGGVLSDRILKRTGNVVAARRNVIIGAFLGALVFLAPVLFVKSLPIMAASMSLSFFFLEMTIGPIWAVPMDITPSTSASRADLSMRDRRSRASSRRSCSASSWITPEAGRCRSPDRSGCSPSAS